MRAWFVLWVLFSSHTLAVERVLDFHSSISIEKNGELLVTERIAVQAEGREIRRGIVRDFPTKYRDRAGNEVHVPFHVLRVTRDGRPEASRVEPMSNGARLRIGDPAVMLTPGQHVYEIT